jgi:transcriptional antiterminator NusG
MPQMILASTDRDSRGEALFNPCVWIAAYTNPRAEKRVRDELDDRGIPNFLPLLTRPGRRHPVSEPLFPSYIFCHVEPEPFWTRRIVDIKGVARLLSYPGEDQLRHPFPIPDDQIAGVRLALSAGLVQETVPLVDVGRRVRIGSGILKGVEGLLTERRGRQVFVMAVEGIGRSITVDLSGYKVDIL